MSEASEQPATVGRYRLAYELASGGMATVYLARSGGAAGFEKVVALKRIHPHLAREQDFIEMFLDEARIASRINHPNVCSVFDFGEVDGTYYIAMEYVLGETLARILRRLTKDRDELLAPATLGYACRIVADACDGLHAAHELRGDGGKLLEVVHRDVSPQNLFVSYDGTVRVVDFGIARAAGRLHETRTGAVKGKLAYMAPEQSRKLSLDRRADVWALGCVLWELVCGERLFKRDSDVETIMAVVADDIPKPSSRRSDMPPELELIIMKALERDRDKRYSTARELGRDLHRFLGKLEEPVTTGDVADWMGRLFAKEKQQRLGLVDAARTVKEGLEVQRIAPQLSDEYSGSEVRPTASHTTPAKKQPNPPSVPPEMSVGGLTMEVSEDDIMVATAAAEEAAAGRLDDAPSRQSGAVPVSPPFGGEANLSAFDAASETPVLSPAEPFVRGRPTGLFVGVGVGAVLLILVWFIAFGGSGDDADDVDDPSTGTAATEAVETTTGDAVGEEDAVEDPPDTTAREGDVVAEGAEVDQLVDVAPDETAVDDGEEEGIEADVAEAPAVATMGPRRGTARPRHPTPRVTPTPNRPGFVDLATPGGWADVYLGGRNLGRAPGRIQLASGRQSLEVRPFGRADQARRVLVTVQPGESQRLVVNLR